MQKIRRLEKLLRSMNITRLFIHKNTFSKLDKILSRRGYTCFVTTMDTRFTKGEIISASENRDAEGAVYLKDSHEPLNWTKKYVSEVVKDYKTVLIGPKKGSKRVLEYFEVAKRFYRDDMLVALLPCQQQEYGYKEYEFEEVVTGIRCDFVTAKGLFSYTHLDPATRFLLESVELEGTEDVLDFGVGYGALTCFVAKKYPGVSVTGVDSNQVAVEYARKNMVRNGVSEQVLVNQSYLLTRVSGLFDVILCNPPTHMSGEEAQRVFGEMKKVLKGGGKGYMVVNKAVRYESLLKHVFGSVHVVDTREKFKILSVTR